MIYIKSVNTTDKRFIGRATQVFAGGQTGIAYSSIPVPDTTVLCDGCNRNLCPGVGYLVYLSKRELTKDQPYDIFCEDCVRKYFPKAKEVKDVLP